MWSSGKVEMKLPFFFCNVNGAEHRVVIRTGIGVQCLAWYSVFYTGIEPFLMTLIPLGLAVFLAFHRFSEPVFGISI